MTDLRRRTPSSPGADATSESPPTTTTPPYPFEEPFGFATRAVHAGAHPDPATGSRNVPIHQTTSYVFDDVDHAAALFNLQTFGYIYSRLTNPTVAALEERVAALEGGRGAVAASSGHAAQLLAFFTLLEPGDDIVAAKQLYGGSLTQFRHTFRRLGWNAAFVDVTDLDAFRAAIGPNTKALFVESISNPGGVVADLEALAEIAHEAGIPLIVDNTMATPFLCRPFEWGADLAIHSLTKFLSGHGTSMGGVVVESGRFDWAGTGKFPFLAGPDPGYHGLDFIETFGDFGFSMKARAVALRDLGPALSPTNAFMILTGIETLPLRIARHVANAQAVAEFLETHPAVSWVSYAGLPSNSRYELARKYAPLGPGSVFTIGLDGGFDAGVRLVESVNLWSHLANVGDTRSLILHPASTTHRQLSDEERTAAGAGPDVVRLSVGIETVDDLIADLDQALHQHPGPGGGRARAPF
jgi:O-acetylhomoserine (thiol)-lyase